MTKTPVILQAEVSECGLAAIAMIVAAYGGEIELAELRHRYACRYGAPTLKSMLDLATQLDLVARPLRVSLAEIAKLRLPAILHWEFEHFVVLTRVGRNHIVIHDPAIGRRRIGPEESGRAFTGIAVEFSRAQKFEATRRDKRPSLRSLISSFDGFTRYMAVMLVLMFASQVLALAPPVATQLLIDDIVFGQDVRWLYRVLAGLACIMLAIVLIDTMRRQIAIFTGVRLATDSSTSVIRHVLSLPPASIQRRPVGDLMSRLDSLRPVRAVLTETGVNAIVQCSVIAMTIGIMFFYSARLAILSVVALFAQALLQAFIWPPARSLSLESIVASASASNSLIETFRGFASVFSQGLDAQRISHWSSYFAQSINASAREARLRSYATAGSGVINALEQVCFLAIGISGVVDKRLTLGVLFAFIGLRGRLVGASMQLINALRDIYLLRPHVERIGELTGELKRPSQHDALLSHRLRGAICGRKLCFRYPGGPWLLDKFDFRVGAGESVVISGPSGVGKSTLLAIIAGSLNPERGEVLFDDMSAMLWHRDSLVQQVGVVLQRDRLFQGSIADNISCFDASPDITRIRDAAMLAEVWTDIERLPMNLHTPIVGAGGGLSGGQVQRLLLARALYRQPRILLLDEATSHLDQALECNVLDNLRGLRITIVSVAHRQNAIDRAERHIVMNTMTA